MFAEAAWGEPPLVHCGGLLDSSLLRGKVGGDANHNISGDRLIVVSSSKFRRKLNMALTSLHRIRLLMVALGILTLMFGSILTASAAPRQSGFAYSTAWVRGRGP